MTIYTLSIRTPFVKGTESKLIQKTNFQFRDESITAFFQARQDFETADIFLTGCEAGRDEREDFDILTEIRKRDV